MQNVLPSICRLKSSYPSDLYVFIKMPTYIIIKLTSKSILNYPPLLVYKINESNP